MAALGWVVAALLAVAVIVLAVTVARARGVERRLADAGRERDRLSERAAAAARSEGTLRRALDAIVQGVVIADADGTVAYRNPAADAFLESRHGEALVEAAIRDLLAGAVAGGTEARTIELFGPPRRVVDVVAAPLSGSVAGGLVVVEDVSERHRLEAVRRDFVANISHELKTPIGAIGLLAETLMAEDDPAVTRRLASRMVSEAFRVGRTIDDLLELTRIEAGETAAHQPVPVHLVVGEAVDRITPAAELRSVAIERTDPDPALTIVGDRRQLVSALYNLLDNAVKYSDDGAVVSLSVGHHDGLVDVVVADHGPGIPSREIERVFERFYRVDRARSRDTGGTGLGLAIVRHVVGNHAGEVLVESQEGAGSTFTLRFPAGPLAVHDHVREAR